MSHKTGDIQMVTSQKRRRKNSTGSNVAISNGSKEGSSNPSVGETSINNTYEEPPHEDSPDCWCFPEVIFVDPESGHAIWRHGRAH